MKKLLLGIGSIATVVAPVAAVISCGTTHKDTNAKPTTHTLTGAVFGEITTGLSQTLAIPANDVKDAIAGENFSSGTFHVDHYTKITFKNNTTYDAGNGAQAVKAGETIIIGSTASHRRAATSNVKVAYINDKGVLKDLTATLASHNKLAALKTAVVDKVAAHIQAQQPTAGSGTQISSTGASVDPTDATKVKAGLKIQGAGVTMPTHLDKAQIEPIMAQLKAIATIANITTIEYTVNVVNTNTYLTDTKLFVINVAAGKANDVDAIAAAASTVTGIVPGSTTPPSTGGTTTIDLGAERLKLDSTFSSTMTKAQIATALQGKNANDVIADPATTLGITLPALSKGVSVAFKLQQAFANSSTEAILLATLSAQGVSDETATMRIAPKAALTQTAFDSWNAPNAFITQTSVLSKVELDAKITAGSITLKDMKLAALATVPNGTQAGDYTVALAVKSFGTAGWSGGKLFLEATITYTPASLTKKVDIEVTPTAPVDLNNLSAADFNALAAMTTTAHDADVDSHITYLASQKTIHWDSLTASDLGIIFNETNQHTIVFPSTITSAGKTYNIKYKMTKPTKGAAKGPYSITAVATSVDGFAVTNNEKTFAINTSMNVTVAKDFIEQDGSDTTQLNVGKTGKIVEIDRDAPKAAADITAEFVNPIVDAIAGFSAHTTANAAIVGAAITVLITFNDGSAQHTLTLTVTAGAATDKAAMLLAAQNGTLT